MFTVQQIELAHGKVKYGADFPKYIQEIKELGVIAFETFVKDSHTQYFGENNFSINSLPQYEELYIAEITDAHKFMSQLKLHQQGKTDYFTFCKDCAEAGIEKWKVDLNQMTCTYYDQSDHEILVEEIPN
ncbi:MAG: DUF1398 family protein [Cloacibacterium sp.]|uniref:DUF1398 domain-containing protein n=1 Tax=Cloacibacterium sp. TaxID=1913682 RepID=UPI003C76EDCD